MLPTSLTFLTGGHCTLTYEKRDGWLRATWAGQINTDDAMAGARNYLAQAGPLHCLYLLNDNEALRGPWFDSVEWLERAWLPQAIQLGLRYIAHVVQQDSHNDILTLTYPTSVVNTVELQLFDEVTSAEAWLRTCQHPLSQTAHRLPFE